MLGETLSTIVKVAFVVVLLKHSSLTVNVTVAKPVAPQPLLKFEKLFVQFMFPQKSVAIAPPCEFIQLLSSIVLPVPLLSTTLSIAGNSISGSSKSITVITAFVIVLPHSSVAVKFTIALPEAPQSLLKEVKSFVQVSVPQ